jgi:hypothetical protein
MGLLVRVLFIAGAWGASTALGQARTTGVVGVVRDSTGVAVTLATITVERFQAITDTGGRFSLDGLPAGRNIVSIRRLGFRPSETVLDLVDGRRDSLFVTMVALPLVLPGVTTAADERLRQYLADYHRHKASGAGRFYDRAEITAMRVGVLTDVLRRVPGVMLVPDRNGRYIVRMGRSTRNCPPDYWIDNVRAYAMNADDIPLMDIEAIEIYAGPAGLPPEFINRFGNPACGAVVIWTRMPG